MAAAGGATPRTIRVGGMHRCSHAYISHTIIFRRTTARPADVGVLNATPHASPPASTETPHQLLAARRADAATLIEWLQLRDGTVLGVDLVYEQRPDGSLGRTLIATQDLAPGDVLVDVPLSCTLHCAQHDDGSGDTEGHAVALQQGQGVDADDIVTRLQALRQLQARIPVATGSSRGAWQFKVALELLYHVRLGCRSPLAPYIATLPGWRCAAGVDPPQVAMQYEEDERAELQYGPAMHAADGQAHWRDVFAADVLAKLPAIPSDNPFGAPAVDASELGWALSVAMSRAFAFPRLGSWALVPLVDMCDHHATPNAEVHSSSSSLTGSASGGGRARDGRVRLIADAHIRRGEPVLLRYGRHNNTDLLLSYGFVSAGNSADALELPLSAENVLAAVLSFTGGELPPSGRALDGLRQWQRTALGGLGLLLSEPPLLKPDGSDASAGQQAAPEAAAEQGSRRSLVRGAALQLQPVTPPAAADAADADGQAAAPPAVADAADADDQAAAPPADAAAAGVPPCSSIVLGGPGLASPLLLAAVRVMLAPERALLRGRSSDELGDWDKPLSTAHEALVLKALVGLVTVVYKGFPTTIQQDTAALAALKQQDHELQLLTAAAGQQPSSDAAAAASTDAARLRLRRLETAVQYRLELKRVLERAVQELLRRLRALEGGGSSG